MSTSKDVKEPLITEHPSSSSKDIITPKDGRILYAVVARDRCVVVEYSPLAGNFTTVARLILEKLPVIPAGQKRSFAYDDYVFHQFQARTGVTFLCLADKQLGREVPYKFLEEVGGKWSAGMPAERQQALIKAELDLSNKPVYTGDQVSRVKSQLAEVTDNMIDNIDRIIQRQEKIEILVEKSDALDRTAAQFRREASDLRRAMWWRQIRARVYFGVFIALIFLFAIWKNWPSNEDNKKHLFLRSNYSISL